LTPRLGCRDHRVSRSMWTRRGPMLLATAWSLKTGKRQRGARVVRRGCKGVFCTLARLTYRQLWVSSSCSFAPVVPNSARAVTGTTDRYPVARGDGKRQPVNPGSETPGGGTPGRSRVTPQAETDYEPRETERSEFIGIPEWSRRAGCSRESGYRVARRDEIPGLFRTGRLKRVNWAVFVRVAAHPSSGDETVSD
jgi:hypothetical protein